MKNLLGFSAAGEVTGESILFRRGEPGMLLCAPERILRVYSPLTGEVFTPGRDYEWEPGRRTVFRPAGSRMPEAEWVMTPPGTPGVVVYPEKNCTVMPRGRNGMLIRLGPADWYASHRVEVDYLTREELPSLPEPLRRPERFIAKLRRRETVVVSVVGDSITVGWNSTAVVKCPPFSPPYIEQAVADLRESFGGEIVLRNHAISGTGTAKAMELRDQWGADHADLLVVAYGMNDLSSRKPAEYARMIAEIIQAKKALDPESEILLVASMPRNPDWEPELYIPHGEYAGVLHGIAATREDTSVADVHALWCAIQARKSYYDLTGNGVNHANDYGHRIYAAAVRNCFPEK